MDRRTRRRQRARENRGRRPVEVVVAPGHGIAAHVRRDEDATVVRLVLVPATMELLGDRNWWFPKALEWLPRIHVEGAAGSERPLEWEPEPAPALGD
jgi:hypothetical protein